MDFENELKRQLQKFVADIGKDLEDKENEKEYPLHTLTDDEIKRFKTLKSQKRKAIHDLQQFKREMEFKIEEEMERVAEEIQAHHEEVWNDIYRKYDLDPNQRYSIDVPSKTINQYIKP